MTKESLDAEMDKMNPDAQKATLDKDLEEYQKQQDAAAVPMV